jgi:hypothetical protein
MSKGGRPMIQDAVRWACGKINKAETARQLAVTRRAAGETDAAPPSPKVRMSRDFFSGKWFKGGGLGNHAGDAIGQLWLVGRLDIDGMDETRLLNAARCWWHGREMTFKDLGHKTAKYERASRTSNSSAKATRAEQDYQRYEKFLLDAADYDRDVLFDLMQVDLDGEIAGWASRIIQTEIVRFIRLPIVLLAGPDDYAKLDAAKRALVAMAGAEAVKRQAA